MSEANRDWAAREVKPMDRDRLEALLKERSQRYYITDDGRLGGIWDLNNVTFAMDPSNSVLQARGHWHRAISLERREEFTALINEIHSRYMWPKVVLSVQDDGVMRLAAEMAVPIARGLSDTQLTHLFGVSITASSTLFNELDERFPDPLLGAPA